MKSNPQQATAELQTSPTSASSHLPSACKAKSHSADRVSRESQWTEFNQNETLFKSNLYYPRLRTGVKFIRPAQLLSTTPLSALTEQTRKSQTLLILHCTLRTNI